MDIRTTLPDLFTPRDLEATVARLNALTSESTPRWGSMTVGQMLAHCSVAYEMVYTDRHPRPNPLMRWVLRRLVRPRLLGPAPFPHDAPTAPAFKVRDARDFATERDRLIAYLRQAGTHGRGFYEGHESKTLGRLTADEWNVLFAKHLDHHLRQFGV